MRRQRIGALAVRNQLSGHNARPVGPTPTPARTAPDQPFPATAKPSVRRRRFALSPPMRLVDAAGMTQGGAGTARVAAAARLLADLLRTEPRYRDLWMRRAARTTSTDLNLAAVSRVIAEQLWDSGEQQESRTTLPRELKDKVARALRGTVLTPETLQWFIDAFGIRSHHADQLWAAYSGTHATTVTGSLARPVPLVVEQLHRTIAVFEHHQLDADGRRAVHTTVHAITALDTVVDRYVYVPHIRSADVTVRHGGTIESRFPFGTELDALEIRLTTPLNPGQVTSLRYDTRFPERLPPTEFRRFAHNQTDNVDIRVTFHPHRLPSRVWWAVWDDYSAGRLVHEEPVALDTEHSVHRFLRLLERSAAGFRWQW
ncbi:hypothetical protein AB0J72_20875 [Dactylosporangium sp. NPDC049742]|uniref:hypothetical protein n=1 Tax=Dactylosporangium sp. NPDC049742 TaxID=3154737 RepID=UPI003435FFFC